MRALSLTTPALRSPALPAKPRHVAQHRHSRAMVATQAQQQGEAERPGALQKLQSAAVAVAAAGWLAAGSPALAEIQTVPMSEATQMAKPLKQEPIDKGRIWLLMVLGGTALFGCTVLLENNEQWFPAITKANQAMKATKKQQQQQEASPAVDEEYEREQERQRLALVEVERELERRQQAAVLAGLQEASRAVAAPTEEAQAPPAQPQPAVEAAAVPTGLAEVQQAQHDAAEDAAAAQDAQDYPPLIFERGSLTAVGSEGAMALQGMTDEQLEAALNARKERDAAAAQQ